MSCLSSVETLATCAERGSSERKRSIRSQQTMAKSTIILSINAGSSSVKVTLFKAEDDRPQQIAAGQISGLSAPPAQFNYTRGDNTNEEELPRSVKTHNDAFGHILEAFLNDKDLETISRRDHIDYACHRVVHGVGGLPTRTTACWC
jgi:acetate kinase